jgi:hypothetical protein
MRNNQRELSTSIQAIRDAKDAKFGVIESDDAVELLEAYDEQVRMIENYRKALLEQKDGTIQNAARKIALEQIFTMSKKALSDAMAERPVSVTTIREIVRIADVGAHL